MHVRGLRLLPLLLVAAAAGSGTAAGGELRPAAGAPRILYASDWSGPSQIYAVDPTGRLPRGQLTFGPAPACLPENPCGYVQPLPSPDGRRVLYWDYVLQGPRRRSGLFVARADGTRRRKVAEITSFLREASWAPDSRRIAYMGASGAFVVNADGSGRRRVYRHRGSPSQQDRVQFSRDGRALAILRNGNLIVIRGRARRLARQVDDFAWAPRAQLLAYLAEGHADGLFLVRPDGSRRTRIAASTHHYPYSLEWSPTGRQLVHDNGFDGVRIVDLATRATRNLGGNARCCARISWSNGGQLFAYDDEDDGVTIVDVLTGNKRHLGEHAATLGWSPDGGLLAYVVARDDLYLTGDLRVAPPAGSVRTVVEAAGDHGGQITSVHWTRPPNGTSYRPPAPRVLATVQRDQLVARNPIERLAADGGRVAYSSCGQIVRWTPSTGEVVQAEAVASLSPRCSSRTYNASNTTYSLAIAGDRVVHGRVDGGIGRNWWLGGVLIGSPQTAFTLGEGSSTAASNVASEGTLVGDPVGAGGLLVFSTWNRNGPGGPCCFVTEQALLRAEPSGCPCPEIAVEPGPYVPFDVNEGRVAAGGDNELRLLDGTGARLLSVPVRALAAQLHARDLVVLVRGQLRHYDAETGSLTATWPLPDVPSRGECTAPVARNCPQARLVLHDVARGLAAYVLDGRVHVLRLSDGADAVVGPGTLARFIDAGLVYADGARLRLVPFSELPV